MMHPLVHLLLSVVFLIGYSHTGQKANKKDLCLYEAKVLLSMYAIIMPTKPMDKVHVK